MKNLLPLIGAIMVVIIGCIGIHHIHKSNYYQELAEERWHEIEDLKDCRMQLHAHILRERGEMKYPKNPNICHIEPLAEQCDCFVGRLKWED